MKKYVEKMKRFWNFNAKNNGGFTLVELIVVIAILAILAGIAVPAYSGYVEKARKAEDEQLLATVNTAFAAACIENGTDVHSLTAADKVEIDLVEGKVDLASVSHYAEDFKDYYAGNEDAKFETFTDIYFSSSMHKFVANAEKSMQYGGATISIPQEYIDMIDNSTFLQAATLGGTDGLLTKIADVSDFASVIIGQGGNASDLLNGVIGSPEFLQYAANALGIDPTDNAAFAAKDAELIAALRAKDPALAVLTDTELRNKYMTNATVLFAANNATNMNKEEIMAALTNQDVKQNIINTMDTNTTSAFSQATLAYGMYTAWAHASGNTEAQNKNELEVMNDLNNEEFQSWLTSSQGQQDLDAYLSALKVVDANSQDADAVSNLVVNGFGDSELKDAVGSLFD